MMRKTLVLFVFLMILGVLFCRPGSHAAEDGEALFNSKCGKCHTNGKSPVFAPVKYASSQWERFFKRNKHERKKDISEEVSEEEADAIKKYLIDHAADSDRPIAAGLR
ncbi:MAG TPA: cytochrome c [Desulfobacterales bacterium]|nr:cytochrome c [Desulfobacterales bacterium]